jgi:hypothetical protein
MNEPVSLGQTGMYICCVQKGPRCFSMARPRCVSMAQTWVRQWMAVVLQQSGYTGREMDLLRKLGQDEW